MLNWMFNELNVELNVEWIECWIECWMNWMFNWMLNELNVELNVEWIECWIECLMNWMLNWMLNELNVELNVEWIECWIEFDWINNFLTPRISSNHGKQMIYWLCSKIRANQSPDLWTVPSLDYQAIWLCNSCKIVVKIVRYNNFIQFIYGSRSPMFRPQNYESCTILKFNWTFDTAITPSII